MACFDEEFGRVDPRQQASPGRHGGGLGCGQRNLAPREAFRARCCKQAERKGQPGADVARWEGDCAATREQSLRQASHHCEGGKRFDLLDRDVTGISPGCRAAHGLFGDKLDLRPPVQEFECAAKADDSAANDKCASRFDFLGWHGRSYIVYEV